MNTPMCAYVYIYIYVYRERAISLSASGPRRASPSSSSPSPSGGPCGSSRGATTPFIDSCINTLSLYKSLSLSLYIYMYKHLLQYSIGYCICSL